MIKSADPLLDAAARESVEQWRYEPFVVDGLPVKKQLMITVHYDLQ